APGPVREHEALKVPHEHRSADRQHHGDDRDTKVAAYETPAAFRMSATASDTPTVTAAKPRIATTPLGPSRSLHRCRSEAGRVMRFVRGLQLLQLGVGHDEVERGDCVADVVRLGGADDRRGDAGPAGH